MIAPDPKPNLAALADARDPVAILYTNWRGRTSVRHLVLVCGDTHLSFGANEWHRQPQWLIHALDIEKGEHRDFAICGIKAWGQEAVNAALSAAAPPAPDAGQSRDGGSDGG